MKELNNHWPTVEETTDELIARRDWLKNFHSQFEDWTNVLSDKWARVALIQGKIVSSGREYNV